MACRLLRTDGDDDEPKGNAMHASSSSLGLVLALLVSPIAQAQELSPRMGFAAFFTHPTDEAAKLYGSGWKVNLTVHVQRESTVEGRLRFEIGEFREGENRLQSPYSGIRYKAQTRLVGYDWLIPFGQKQETGVDLILGIGGAHWYRETKSFSLPGNPNPYSDSTSSSEKLAFAGTVGFRVRLTRNVELEIHQVLTSLPGSNRDFEDAELSHTAIGVGLRF
jgi:hypothetical protein